MKYIMLLTAIFSLISCAETAKDKISFVPLSEFQKDQVALENGTALKIIGFSGGKPNDANTVYYQQALVQNLSTGDTLFIICPLLKIPQPDEATGRNYISPLDYNATKAIGHANFERKTDSLNMLLQVMGDEKENSDGPIDVGRYMNLEMIKKEMVAKNKWIPLFQNKYKTAVGILSFTEDPR